MKTIYQAYETDCGPACVAMLCNVNLPEAKSLIYKNTQNSGSASSGELLQAIKSLGRTSRSSRCLPISDKYVKELKYDCLLKCKILAGEKYYTHWVVWDFNQQVIRDPFGYIYPIQITHYIEFE